jgi:hypothetical protein
MRRFSCIIAFICLASALPADAETKILTTEGSGILIESLPTAAKVYLDGIERGLTPLSIDNISPGVHTLRVTKEWHSDWSARIAVSARERLEAFIELTRLMGKVTVNTTAPHEFYGKEEAFEPHIFLDGVEQNGHEFVAAAGWRTIKVSAFGWEDAQKQVFIGDKEEAALNFELARSLFTLSNMRISRSAFNPSAMGARGIITVDFTVNAPGSGRFKVIDGMGNEVFVSALNGFRQPVQRCAWDGRDSGANILKDGDYKIKIEAEDSENKERSELSAAARIDSSLDDQPVTLSSAQPGLFFVNAAAAQSKGSFQIETSIIAGKPLGETTPFDTILFAAALCFTPLTSWQFSAAVNIRPDKDGTASTSAAGTAKKELRKPAGLMPGIAAALSYAWVKDGFESAFGMKSGIQAMIPFSWRAGRILSLYFTPTALWTGKDGFLPRIVISEGLLCSFKLFSAGLSVQSVIPLEADLDGFSPAALSAEFKFTPPASNLSIGLQTGSFFNNDDTGVYGGFSIGAFF